MDRNMIALIVGDGGIIISAVGAVLSVLLYARVRWWETEVGRHMMGYQFIVASVLTLGVAKLLLGDNEFWAWLRVIVFLGVPVVIWWQAWLVFKLTRRRK